MCLQKAHIFMQRYDLGAGPALASSSPLTLDTWHTVNTDFNIDSISVHKIGRLTGIKLGIYSSC